MPEEARDALYLLASGYSVEEAADELSTRPKEKGADVDDFSAALANPGSARQFKLVETDADLAQMLDEATRARDEPLIADTGKPSEFLARG